MVMLLFKLQTNPIMNMTESLRILDIFEKVLGLICIAFIILIVNKNSNLFLPAEDREKIFFFFFFFCNASLLFCRFIHALENLGLENK